MKTYCLPGLGTDHRVFQNLIPQLPVTEVVYLDFKEELLPKSGGIEDYALVLSKEIAKDIDYNPDEPILLLGLSLGGFVAVELHKLLPNSRLILISTIKSKRERPFVLNLGRRLPLYNLVPTWFSRNMVPLISRWMRVTDKEGYHLYRQMLKGWSGKTFRWARRAAVNWRNENPPEQVLHIHGTRDHIFPHKHIKIEHYIQGGSHYMVMDRAKEIAALIKPTLANKINT